MTGMDRRTFLGTGARASAALAVGGALPAAGAAVRTSARAGQPEFISVGTLIPMDLTVGGWSNPVGTDPDDCWFAWKLSAPGRTATQKAYRVVVRRTDPGHGGVVWDSGHVVTARQAFVRYGGPSLAGDAAYSWTVRVQDKEGGWSAPSAPSSFVTALRQGDWTATWLQPAWASPGTRPRHLRTR